MRDSWRNCGREDRVNNPDQGPGQPPTTGKKSLIAAGQPSPPARAAPVPIDSSIPKEAADAIHAADWEKVSTILQPLAG